MKQISEAPIAAMFKRRADYWDGYHDAVDRNGMDLDRFKTNENYRAGYRAGEDSIENKED